MFSPYEELEYLSDYLPAEGEVVLVSREAGELVCKPWQNDELRDGIHDSSLYGLLVQSNERLSAIGTFPIWMTVIGLVWLAILCHGVLSFGIEQWYVVPGLAFPMMYLCYSWIRRRQAKLYREQILPVLKQELRRRNISAYALIAGVRQHGEFRTLLDELVRCS